MVYRRKRTYRKKTPKRTYRKRFNRRSRYNKRGQKVFLFKRFTGAFGTLTLGSITNSYAAYNFSLSDLPNYTEFTALYDMYKINCVKMVFIPQMDTNVSLSTVNNPYASSRFFSVIDYNDGTAPLTIDELREYHTCKFTPILKTHKRVIYKPKILDSSSYSISPWMSTASPSTNYYGLKVGVEAMSSFVTTSFNYNIEAKFYMSFKNVK